MAPSPVPYAHIYYIPVNQVASSPLVQSSSMDSHRPHSKTKTDPQPTSHPQTSFPLVAVSLIGIFLTVIFLLTYYIIVVTCCRNQRDPGITQRLTRSRRRRPHRSTRNRALPSFHTGTQDRGLHKSAIQAIPVLHFRSYNSQSNSSHECSVCLYEFEEEEKIRMLPSCFHVFHIGCIDTWLQAHSNCPLCRAAVTCSGAPVQSMRRGDHTAVAIDAGEEYRDADKRVKEGLSFGDECLDFRGRDEEFAVVAIRRSFSLGSFSDRRLYATVQGILSQNPHFRMNLNGEGSCSYSDVK